MSVPLTLQLVVLAQRQIHAGSKKDDTVGKEDSVYWLKLRW